MTKDFKKDETNPILLVMTETMPVEVKTRHYTIKELKEIVALKESELADFQAALAQALSLGVVE